MALLRANADDLLHVGLDEVLFQRWAEKKPMYKSIYDVRSSDRKYEKTSGFSGFTSLVEKAEGTDLTVDDPIQGYDTTFTHKSYGLYARITKEMNDDDLKSRGHNRAICWNTLRVHSSNKETIYGIGQSAGKVYSGVQSWLVSFCDRIRRTYNACLV